MEDDMAGTNGPFIAPKMFREINFPYVKQRIQFGRKIIEFQITRQKLADMATDYIL